MKRLFYLLSLSLAIFTTVDSNAVEPSFSPKALQQEDIKAIRKAAESGDMEAQYKLASAYARGEGISKDMSEAVK